MTDSHSEFSTLNSPLVPAGYKRTEIGVIPEDWEVKPIADLVEPTAPVCYGVVQVGADTENGVPIVAIKFVKEIAHAALHRTAESLERPYVRSRPQCGDVLISIKGTIGRVGIVPDGFNGNISRELARIRIGKANCGEYVAHQLEADATQHRIIRSVVGTTRLEFSIATLRQFQVPVPSSKAEQRAIATALSDVDALLGALQRLIAKKRDLKQAAMQQLLTGQTRLPGFHGQWEVERLGDVCRITTGKKDVNEGNPDGLFPFFTCSRSHTFSDSYSFDTEAILIAGNGDVGNLHYFNGKFEAYQRTYVLSEFTAHVQFLWQQLSGYLAASLGLGKIGSSIPYIKKENLVEFEFNKPKDDSEQTAIAEVLSDMDAEIAALEQRREKTRALKQGMMQELLTGRVRLIEKG